MLTPQHSPHYAHTYLKAMGIDLWLLRTNTEEAKETSKTIESHARIAGQPEKQNRQIQKITVNKAVNKVSTKIRAQIPKTTLLGQQNVAFIQTTNVSTNLLVVALIGQHMNLPGAHLNLITRMLHRCSIDTQKVEHSVLDTMSLYSKLHFCDQDIANTLLSHIHKKQEQQACTHNWIILLGSTLEQLIGQQLKAKLKPKSKTLLIQQEIIDLLSFPETRKQAWEALLPLREHFG